jgi:hypothetical protein
LRYEHEHEHCLCSLFNFYSNALLVITTVLACFSSAFMRYDLAN